MLNHLSSPNRITALPAGVLQIYDVGPKDAGNYRCVAATVAHRRKSMEASLTVTPGTSQKFVFLFLFLILVFSGTAINFYSLAIMI